MQIDLLNIGLAFLEGFALIISPCILPILPIILSGSLEGSKKRPLGIVLGFIVIFSLFTFFSRALVIYTGIDLTIVRYVSYALLFLFGIIMLSTYLSDKFNFATQRLASVGSSLSTVNNSQGGFLSGIILGALVGFIWTPCAGPILAVVIVQSVLQQTSLSSFFVILFFGIGAAIPMLLIALFGRNIMRRFVFFKTHAYLLRKILGLIIIAAVAYMLNGESVCLAPLKSNTSTPTTLINGITPYPAPDIIGITEWINSTPLQIQQLKGKVVLVDFWAYSCINCIRTLPYLIDWYQKYHDKGLVIVGVHSPEFEFERDVVNVKNSVEKDKIHYPVALDNNFATWKKYNNQYWPAHYLIDKKGNVVYTHFGEGDYDITEGNIRYLLGVSGKNSLIEKQEISAIQTPETYLGSARAATYSSPEKMMVGRASLYSMPASLKENHWALSGSWMITPEKIISAKSDAELKIKFTAKKIFIVMGTTVPHPIKVKVLLNGQKVILEKGKDVVDSTIEVSNHQLYDVVVLPKVTSGILQIIPMDAGLEIYTFTFG